MPIILDEKSGRVAVRVVDVNRDAAGKKTYTDLGIVEASYDAPGVAPTEPLLEIRILSIE